MAERERAGGTGRSGTDGTARDRARRALVVALDRLLDEGITDYSARTRASRRRMAALYAGFVHAEELLAALGAGPRRPTPDTAAADRLAAVLAHLVYWAEVDGHEDPSAATRAALAAAHLALERLTGSAQGRHAPPLLDCERCAAPGAELPRTSRADATCRSCAAAAVRSRRLRAL